MLMFLLFVLCMLERTEVFKANLWTKTKHSLPITTGQNCTFPCNWINKDFRLTIGNNVVIWNVSETTFVEDFGTFTTNYECFKIFGRFLIVRETIHDDLLCFTIEINNADSFTALYPQFSSLDTDECTLCNSPAAHLFKMSAVDTVAQNQTGPECNIPVGCTPHPMAPHPIVCVDNGNIEGDCNEATTPPSPPPTKRCKHKHQ